MCDLDQPAGPSPEDRPRSDGAGRLRRRDRHGRGLRGSMSLPGPYSPARPPIDAGRAARFDGLVLDCVERLERKLGAKLELVEFAVEDVPTFLPDDPDELALGTTVVAVEDGPGPVKASLHSSGAGGSASSEMRRVVVYRRPIELRARGRADVVDLVLDVLVEQLTTLLELDPDAIDPRPE